MVVSGALVCIGTAAHAEQFYKGKSIQLVIGYGVGGGYDLYGRTLARHIGRFIPGHPDVVPQNMTGAGSLKAANYLYNAAPRDGLSFGIIGNGIAYEPLFGGKGVEFKALEFNWIGSLQSFVQIAFSWHTSPVKTFDDVKTHELVVGATGSGSGTNLYPRLLNTLFGTKFKVISGYKGTNEINLAIERGELQGLVGWDWNGLVSKKPEWIRDKKVNVFLQLALKKHPDHPDVPSVIDLATDPQDKAILKLALSSLIMGRPFVAPPGVPADRVRTLQHAFAEMAKDRAFLADAKRVKLEISPMTGPEVDALLREAYAAPKDIVEATAKALNYR